jgi:hypothetical protein
MLYYTGMANEGQADTNGQPSSPDSAPAKPVHVILRALGLREMSER